MLDPNHPDRGGFYVPYYSRLLAAINVAAPFLARTQAANLALLIAAILLRRTLCLTELARAIPTPGKRRVEAPKHDLLPRLKRLWRFVDNERVDPAAVQLALIPYTVACLGKPRLLGLAIDWTMWDTVTPGGDRVRYQALRIAVPRRGRALPLLEVAYVRGALPKDSSQNKIEEEALLAVVGVLPPGVRPVVLADRGFARQEFIRWLRAHGIEYVIRVRRGTCLTEPDGRRWRLGEENLQVGGVMWSPGVRYALYHDRPTDVATNIALCWRVPKGKARRSAERKRNPRPGPAEPWYLATSLRSAESAVAWYWQRGWIEQSFRDAKSRFGLDSVRVGCRDRLNRLLMGLTIALSWLTLLALPEAGVAPPGYATKVVARGRASLISLALSLLDELGDLPDSCLPKPVPLT